MAPLASVQPPRCPDHTAPEVPRLQSQSVSVCCIFVPHRSLCATSLRRPWGLWPKWRWCMTSRSSSTLWQSTTRQVQIGVEHNKVKSLKQHSSLSLSPSLSLLPVRASSKSYLSWVGWVRNSQKLSCQFSISAPFPKASAPCSAP